VKNGKKNGDRQKNGKNDHFPPIPIPFLLCVETFCLFSLFTNHEGRKFRDSAGQYMEKWTGKWTGTGYGVRGTGYGVLAQGKMEKENYKYK